MSCILDLAYLKLSTETSKDIITVMRVFDCQRDSEEEAH